MAVFLNFFFEPKKCATRFLKNVALFEPVFWGGRGPPIPDTAVTAMVNWFENSIQVRSFQAIEQSIDKCEVHHCLFSE